MKSPFTTDQSKTRSFKGKRDNILRLNHSSTSVTVPALQLDMNLCVCKAVHDAYASPVALLSLKTTGYLLDSRYED